MISISTGAKAIVKVNTVIVTRLRAPLRIAVRITGTQGCNVTVGVVGSGTKINKLGAHAVCDGQNASQTGPLVGRSRLDVCVLQ